MTDYTPSNSEIVESLIYAKQHLRKADKSEGDNFKFAYICNTLPDNTAPDITEYVKKNIIKPRIDYYLSLEDWLMRVHNIPEEEITYERMQKYRHDWLDMLIKEFSV